MATDDLSKLSGELYRQWESSMTRWWDQVLEDPGFVKGMGENLAGQAKMRGQWEEGVDKSMEAMHLPSRKDVVRLAKIASLLEDRLVALEDRVLEQGDVLQRVEKETLRARIDAAEARVAVQDKLAALDAKLDALLAAANVPAVRPPVARKGAR